ncbi:MAG: sigma-70 family RNA polymerase sigma factor [Verrucomicrobiales bacterium]|nr:sigma-70 family RNA polymerase sigma factor [Verrucomicrobiales bacterium]
MTDWELIQSFAATRDDGAFAELVRRHLGFVHASARRQIGADLAEDVAQSVFLVLARKASGLRPDVVLSAWLFRTTRFVVAQSRREQARRRRREQNAFAMHSLPDPHSPFPSLGGNTGETAEDRLDEALSRLSESDRRYLLTRFVEAQSFPQLAARFGVSEPAARKRVARALTRLRQALLRQGVVVPAAALAALLTAPQADAWPAALAARLAKPGLLPSPHSVTQMTEAAMRAWTWHTARQWAAVCAVSAALFLAVFTVGPLVYRSALKKIPPGSLTHSPSFPGATLLAEMRERRGSTAALPSQGPGLLLTLAAAESGEPIPNAKIGVQRFGSTRLLGAEIHAANAQGQAFIPIEPEALERLRVRASAPARVPVNLTWLPHEFGASPGHHRLALLPGHRFAGRVQDTEGVPLRGAQVALQFSSGSEPGAREDTGVELHLETDAQGAFITDQVPALTPDFVDPRFGRYRPSAAILVSIRHPGYTPRQDGVTHLPEPGTHQVFTLTRGLELHGKVTDLEGNPVSGARVNQAHAPLAGEDVSTAEDGTFILRDLPLEGFTFQVAAPHFLFHQGSIPSAEAQAQFDALRLDPRYRARDPSPGNPLMHPRVEIISPDTGAIALQVSVRLHPGPATFEGAEALDPWTTTNAPPIRLVGRVTDAETGAPIPRFVVSKHVDGWVTAQFLGEGFEGGFDWILPRPPLNRSTLRVTAPGYLPLDSREYENQPDADEWHLDFPLRTTTAITGWIELPEGRPAAGAQVLAASRPASVSLDTWPMDAGRPSDAQGRFQVLRTVTDVALLAIHEAGCVSMPIELSTNTIVRLEPWATVEGRIAAGDMPLVGEAIRLQPSPDRAGMFHFDYLTHSDEEGRFRFQRVPTGQHQVISRRGRTTVQVVNGRASPVQLDPGVTGLAER